MTWALTGCTLMLCWREVSMFSASAKTLTIKLCHSHHIRNPAKKLEFCDIILSQKSCSSFLRLRCSYFTMGRDVQLMWISDTTITTPGPPPGPLPPPKKKRRRKKHFVKQIVSIDVFYELDTTHNSLRKFDSCPFDENVPRMKVIVPWFNEILFI